MHVVQNFPLFSRIRSPPKKLSRVGKKCKGVPAVSIHFQNGLRKAIKSHGAVISFVTKLSSGINWTHKMRAYTDIKKNAAR